MTKRVVHFDRVEIRRVLGIAHQDGFQLSDLSPGVNVIHGPNGSGKSTAAVVIHELLWPGRTGLTRPTVSGRFRDGETDWSVDIDAGHVETRRDGNPGSVPELGPAENRGRYRLALHELVTDDNAGFAKLIADASHGGYDLESAARELRFADRPPAANKSAKVYQEVFRAVKKARQSLAKIESDEGQLPALNTQRAAASAAARRIGLLEKAKEHLEAVANSARLRTQLDAMPAGLAKTRADDRETLGRLDDRRASWEGDLKRERGRIEAATLKLTELSIPAGGIGTDVVAGLRAEQRKLEKIEGDLRRYGRDLEEAEAGEKKARSRLGPDLTDDHVNSVDVVEIKDISTFARSADKARNRDQLLVERRGLLTADEDEAIRGLAASQIHEGITALAQWLAAPPPAATPTARLSGPIYVAVAILAVVGLALTYVGHPAWLALVGAAAAVWIFHRWTVGAASAVPGGAPRKVHRASYEATKLDPPQAWKTEAVVKELRSLIQRAQARAKEDERLGEIKRLDAEVEKAADVRSEVEAQRTDIVERLGLKVDVADEWLPLVVENLMSWQASSTKVAETRGGLTSLEAARDASLQQINAGLYPFAYAAVDSSAAAVGFIEALAERQLAHEGALKDEKEGNDRISRVIDPGLQDVARERSELLERLDLDESRESLVDEWIDELPNYLTLKKAWDAAETIREVNRATLSEDADLLALDALEIDEQINEQRSLADKRDSLSERIAEIEGTVQRAKSGYELSDLLSERDAAESALEDGREQNGATVTGALLTKWVRTVAIESSRPKVFDRARELLVKLTGGKLLLELHDHVSPPVFRARSGPGPAQPVEHLSIGERVQLLIAVRLAFLEQDEPAQLPLLLDEALGTSDDGRAGEIIDTIIEIAREGRQVFYFTAQHDEVGKWTARLEESGVPHEVIDLAEVRKLGATESAPLDITSIELPEPIAPVGMSHAKYGVALGVPEIDPAADDVAGLHLWHVINDVDRLHALLRHRITSWGQLRTLQQYGGKGLVEDGESTFEKASVAAKAIDVACRAWRTGRGRHVDRRALQDSGAVSDNFIHEISELTRRLGGDGEAIVDALVNGEVAGWRKKSTASLRAFFESEGFLTSDEPLSAEDIRVRVQAAVADELRDGSLPGSFIDRVVASFDVDEIAQQPTHGARLT